VTYSHAHFAWTLPAPYFEQTPLVRLLHYSRVLLPCTRLRKNEQSYREGIA
jgi:hypothetical protein